MRKHYLDNGKALASILGFFYHTGLIFSAAWIININPSEFDKSLQFFTEFLTLIRMPLFMFISGYFAIYSVRKYSLKSFSKNKAMRLGVPLISTLLTFGFIAKVYGEKWDTGNYNIIGVFSKYVFIWSKDFNFGHLWFLYLVIVFSFVLYLISSFINKNPDYILIKKVNAYFRKSTVNPSLIDIIIVAISVLLILVSIVLTRMTPYDHALFPITTFATYIPYFSIGILTNIYSQRYVKVFFDLTKKRLFLNISLMLLALIPALFINSSIEILFFTVAKYYALTLVMYLLFKFLNKTNPILKYLGDSSYSIYLLHQPVIVVVAYYFLKNIESNTYISFISILLISIVVTYLIDYLLIRNTKIGKFLFTGLIQKSA